MHISPDGLLVCYLHLQGSYSCVPLELTGYSVLQLATVTGQPGDVCRIWQLPKDGKPKELQTITPPGTDVAEVIVRSRRSD